MTIEKILPRLTHWHSFVKSSHNKISISNAASHLFLSLCGPSKMFKVLAENFFFLHEHTSIAPALRQTSVQKYSCLQRRSSWVLILTKDFRQNRRPITINAKKLWSNQTIWRLYLPLKNTKPIKVKKKPLQIECLYYQFLIFKRSQNKLLNGSLQHLVYLLDI